LLANLVGIGGGIVVVPVVYYGLVDSRASADQAAHVAICTSLAAILPAAIVSSVGHWRAGRTDFAFLPDLGPGIAGGVVVAQFVAPHLWRWLPRERQRCAPAWDRKYRSTFRRQPEIRQLAKGTNAC
jgi:uncharacterized membrane protein YfcA